jgi:hypothetical protein
VPRAATRGWPLGAALCPRPPGESLPPGRRVKPADARFPAR